MRAWVTRGILVLVMAGAVAWAWKTFYPSPENRVRKRLAAVARAASVEADEGQIARLARAQSLVGFFTPDVEIAVEIPGYSTVTIDGRDELLQAAVAARARGDTLKVELVDVTVTMGPDGQTAEAHFTGKATSSRERGLQAQEIRTSLVKTNGQWLIRHAETVQTLR